MVIQDVSYLGERTMESPKDNSEMKLTQRPTLNVAVMQITKLLPAIFQTLCFLSWHWEDLEEKCPTFGRFLATFCSLQ